MNRKDFVLSALEVIKDNFTGDQLAETGFYETEQRLIEILNTDESEEA